MAASRLWLGLLLRKSLLLGPRFKSSSARVEPLSMPEKNRANEPIRFHKFAFLQMLPDPAWRQFVMFLQIVFSFFVAAEGDEAPDCFRFPGFPLLIRALLNVGCYKSVCTPRHHGLEPARVRPGSAPAWPAGWRCDCPPCALSGNAA